MGAQSATNQVHTRDTERRHAAGSGRAQARDFGQRLWAMYQYLLQSRANRKPAPHELDPKVAAGALAASVKGFVRASTSPYVIDKFIRSGTPILITLLVVWLLGRLILVPIQMTATVVGAVIPGGSKISGADLGHAALRGLIANVALLLMLLLRSFLRKPIFKCFIHTMRDTDPRLAQQIESGTPLPKHQRMPTQQQPQSKPLHIKIARLVGLSLLSAFGRKLPVAGWLIAPMMLFSSGERLLGTERALLLAAIGLVPQIAPWALDFLHLWRASHVTGSELLQDYIQKVVPGGVRDEWYRKNEVAMFCFLAPQLLLMELPIVGPLLFLPASAAAAFLASYLHSLPSNRQLLSPASVDMQPAPLGGSAPPPSRPLQQPVPPLKTE